MLCGEVGDIVDVMIFNKDNLQPLAGGEITIVKGNPKKCGKEESIEGKPYKYVSKKDLENIINLAFQDDLE